MKILERYDCVPVLGEVHVKDMDFSRFCKKFTQLAELAEQMKARLPQGYRDYLIDLIVQDCRPGRQTCRDVRWHVDGDFSGDNQYVLWVRVPNRTLFPADVPEITDMPGDRNSQNDFLEKMMGQIPSKEVPDMTFVSYDSRTPHRGVKCEETGIRTFVRALATNYIRPKNIVKEF